MIKENKRSKGKKKSKELKKKYPLSIFHGPPFKVH